MQKFAKRFEVRAELGLVHLDSVSPAFVRGNLSSDIGHFESANCGCWRPRPRGGGLSDVISLSFSDGVQTLDLSTPNVSPTVLVFATSFGDITQWEISLSVINQGGTSTNGISTDSVVQPPAHSDSASIGTLTASSFPGAWALVPEPGTVTLLAMGLVALASLKRRDV